MGLGDYNLSKDFDSEGPSSYFKYCTSEATLTTHMLHVYIIVHIYIYIYMVYLSKKLGDDWGIEVGTSSSAMAKGPCWVHLSSKSSSRVHCTKADWGVQNQNWGQSIPGGLKHVLFFHILRIIIPTDFHIFQRGRYTVCQGILPSPRTPLLEGGPACATMERQGTPAITFSIQEHLHFKLHDKAVSPSDT